MKTSHFGSSAIVNKGRHDGTPPEQVMGSRVVGVIMKRIQDEESVSDLCVKFPHIKEENIRDWQQWHEEAMAREGQSAVLDSLNLVVIQKKGPRMAWGQLIPGEEEFVLVKVRPTRSRRAMWQGALDLLLGTAEEEGGYEAGKPGPSLQARALAGKQ